MSARKKQEQGKLQKAVRSYMRYSTIGLEMAAIIGLGTYGGWWADQRTGWKFPMFTLGGVMGGVAIAIYRLFKQTRTR